MHSVEKGDVNGSAQNFACIVFLKKFVAASLKEMTGRLAAEHIRRDLKFRIDRDTGAGRQLKGVPTQRANLKICSGLDCSVHPKKEVLIKTTIKFNENARTSIFRSRVVVIY